MDNNRITWIIFFILGTAYFSWHEWYEDNNSFMGWFILTSLWSAACGIGYTITDWFLHK